MLFDGMQFLWELFTFLILLPYNLVVWFLVFPYLSKKRTVKLAGTEVVFTCGEWTAPLMVVGSDWDKGISLFDVESNKPRACVKPRFGVSIKVWDERYKAMVAGIKSGKYNIDADETVCQATYQANLHCPYEV